MESIEQFFRNNMSYVFFVYGAAFIFMGVSILIQPLIYGQLGLAANIWLLASFALLHGVNEWLDMMSLIYPSYKILNIVSFIFMVSSFCFLFEFGRRLAATSAVLNNLFRNLHWWLLPAGLAVVITFTYTSGEWLMAAQILSRYFIALPGAVLTAVGLLSCRKVTYIIDRSKLDLYDKYLLTAAIFFIVYGIFAGVVVPKCSAFPSNILNTDSFLSIVHIPVQIFRAISALIIAFSIVGAIRIYYDSLIMKDKLEDKINQYSVDKQEIIRSYRSYYIFAGFVLITTIIILILTVILTKDRAIRKLHEGAIDHLNTYNTYLSDKINNYRTLTKILSERPPVIEYVKHPDGITNMNEYLLQFNVSIGASVAYIINKDGITIASSNFNTHQSLVGKNLSFREYFKNAIKGTPDEYIALGVITGTLGLYSSHPITNSNEIIGVAVIKHEIEIFTAQNTNYNGILFAVDNNEVIFYCSDESYRYHTMHQLPEQVIQTIKDNKQYGDEPLLSLPIINKSEYNGFTINTMRHQDKANKKYTDIEYLEVGTHYKDNDWHVHLFADISGVKNDIIKNVLSVSALMLAILTVGIFIIYRAKSRTILLNSYNDLLKQKEMADNHIKEQEIINAVLKLSLSYDSLEVLLQRILNIILVHTRRPFHLKGCIFLCDEKLKTLQIAASHNFSEEQLSVCSKIPYGKCLCGLSASTNKVVFSSDCNEENHTIKYHDMVEHGHYCIPIISSDRLLGVINVYVKEGHGRNDEDEQFMKTIAHIITVAILRKKEMQLIESDREAGLITMAAGIAHEINNPLSFIKSSVSSFRKAIAVFEHFIRHFNNNIRSMEFMSDKSIELLEQFQIIDSISKMYKKIDISNRGIDRIMEVVNGLKAFSRLNVSDIEEIDINKCIDETLSIKINETCKVNIIKEYSELPMYLCEPRAMNQCFYHILDNALQAVNTTGTIRIVTSRICEAQGDIIAIQIDDDGSGMSAEAVKRAFVPFYTTKEVGSGKGLGLSIVDGIIKRHSGTVNLESTEGKGTSVTIRLPVTNNQMFQ